MDEKTLDSIEFYYESMLALMPGNVYWKDKKGVLRGCNENLARTLKLSSRKDIVGKTDKDISTPEEAKAIKKIDREVMRQGVEQTNEENYTLPDGSIITYLTQRSPVFNKKHEVVGLIGISFDITERKKMEVELKIAKEKAEVANHIKTEFIANMGHDLITPFSDISGIANVLYHGFSDKYPELKEFFEDMVKGCMACEEVHTRIIKGTSIDTREVKSEPFFIQEELSLIQKELISAVEVKKLKLIIPPFESKKADLIETDRLKFHFILVKLLENAVNFTEQGQISVSVVRVKNYFDIKIIDTGIGIPSDKFDYIFEQFTKLFRSNRYGSNFRGVGAGLYLARLQANILNASITVESELEKGSTFTLSIPQSFSES